jgi:DNA mismatch endonuclease (patch repair protein)
MGIKGQIPWNKGKKLSLKHRKNLSTSHLGHTPWNKGLIGAQKRSKASRARFSKFAKEQGFGKWLKGRTAWNKGKKGLYTWSKEQRERYEKAISTRRVQEHFRAHGVKTMKKMIKKDTKIELEIQKILTEKGLKFEKNFNLENITLVDCYLPRLKTAIFADGNYWHRYPTGLVRDRRITATLRRRGYSVLRFWEVDIETRRDWVADKIEDSVETTRKRRKAMI